MRPIALVIALLTVAAIGGTCVPLLDNTSRDPVQNVVLAVALSEPNAARTVPQGEVVRVRWSASNITGAAATFTLLAESRSTGLARTTLLDNISVGERGASGTYSWDTTDFAGTYALVGVLRSGAASTEQRAPGLITVDVPPTLEPIEPTANITFTLGQSPVRPVTISLRAVDTAATVRIGLDEDTDHGAFNNDPNDTDRNEIVIAQRNIPGESEVETISWEGLDSSGQEVEEGTYFLYAIASDGVNDDVVIEWPARITVEVAEPNSTPARVEITDPNADREFLTTDAPLSVTIDINQTQDVLLDLKIDTDDNHQNGNEITILSQRLVKPADPEVVFAWDGTQAGGGAVNSGIYRLVAFTSTGTGTPITDASEGFVFRRNAATQPLIGLIQPAAQQTIEPGNFVNIRWRDSDPNEPSTDPNEASARVRIVLDNDGDPATTGDQVQILADRRAKDDGVSDTFTWQVPTGTLTAGQLYSVIAFIDLDGSAPDDHFSIAPGRLFVKDPTSP